MIKNTDLFYFHVQLNRSYLSLSHNFFLVSVLVLVLLCPGLINMPAKIWVDNITSWMGKDWHK